MLILYSMLTFDVLIIDWFRQW